MQKFKLQINKEGIAIETKLIITPSRLKIIQDKFAEVYDNKEIVTLTDCIQECLSVAEDFNEAAYILFITGENYALNELKKSLMKQGLEYLLK